MFDTCPAFPRSPAEQAPPSRCAPSGWLALELDTALASPSVEDDADLIEGVIAFERLAAWAQARQARLLAEFARRRPPDDDPGARRSNVPSACSEFAADEVALALRLSRMAASARLGLAISLERVLPETLHAWERGMLDAGKVRAIVEACRPLSDEHGRAVQRRVLAGAAEQTYGQLRAALSRAVIAVDPDGAEQRHRHYREDRRVVFNPQPEGMASLWALLPAPEATAAYQRLGQMARALGAADQRGMDARRADLLTELLTGRRCACTDESGCGEPAPQRDESQRDESQRDQAQRDQTQRSQAQRSQAQRGEPQPGEARHGDTACGATSAHSGGSPQRAASKPSVHVTVSIGTLMGLDEQPAELAGYGPIPASLAREIAADGTWHRLLTDPASGTVLDHGRTTYTPPLGLADHVRARDYHCRMPTCRRLAHDADLDHTVASRDGGTTSEHNLYASCRHDHRLKTHAPGWRVLQHPDGMITFTTPTGHHYHSLAHDYRSNPPTPHPDPDPPPF